MLKEFVKTLRLQQFGIAECELQGHEVFELCISGVELKLLIAEARRITALEAEVERLRAIVEKAAGWLDTMSSADGSGHADLGRVLRMDLVPLASDTTRETQPGCHSLCSPQLHVGGCPNGNDTAKESTP